MFLKNKHLEEKVSPYEFSANCDVEGAEEGRNKDMTSHPIIRFNVISNVQRHTEQIIIFHAYIIILTDISQAVDFRVTPQKEPNLRNLNIILL
jgi:hypothetical protein